MMHENDTAYDGCINEVKAGLSAEPLNGDFSKSSVIQSAARSSPLQEGTILKGAEQAGDGN